MDPATIAAGSANVGSAVFGYMGARRDLLSTMHELKAKQYQTLQSAARAIDFKGKQASIMAGAQRAAYGAAGVSQEGTPQDVTNSMLFDVAFENRMIMNDAYANIAEMQRAIRRARKKRKLFSFGFASGTAGEVAGTVGKVYGALKTKETIEGIDQAAKSGTQSAGAAVQSFGDSQFGQGGSVTGIGQPAQ
jgi:hypothetical protein